MHADQFGASRMAGDAIFKAGEAGLLTNAQVAAATTATGVQANITATATHADQAPLAARINSLINIGIADASLNDTDLQAQTTVNGLARLTEVDENRTYGAV
jgi:hypothetical protein